VPASSRRRHWLYPVVVLSGTAVAAFGLFYTLDTWLGGADAKPFFDFQPDRIADSIGNLSGIIAAVLGIIITVVSIIVQLSAERYTHVTEMFFRDRTNMAVLAFYVIGCMCGIFVSFSLGQRFVPRVSLVVMMVVALLGFGLMAPYFAYVFEFLQPEHIIQRIRLWALRAAETGARSDDEEARADAQAEVLSCMEQLTDITINSIQSKDKIIATAGVDALKDLGVSYLELKKGALDAWFAVGPRLRQNPDFVSMQAESVDDLATRRTWVEWKVLRQYQAIYSEALQGMRDINYVCAIDTRYLGEHAIQTEDREALALSVKFFNSYLRATVNAKDVRTAYNILNQYRQLAEAIVRAGWHEKAVEVANYIKYYGHVSFAQKLAFVTETVAYDLCALCEYAHETGSPVENKILRIFLEVDQHVSDAEVQEQSLRGVRKAQVKLATYYLVKGREDLARIIFDDMKHERSERLRSIREELEKVESKDFWEVVDRGTNFDYLPPERKLALETFFAWFGRISGEYAVPPKEQKLKEA
jgi:hypothetical protein